MAVVRDDMIVVHLLHGMAKTDDVTHTYMVGILFTHYTCTYFAK